MPGHLKTILYISPSIKVKGGISTVVKTYLNSELSRKYKLYCVSSYRDGNWLIKLSAAFSGVIFLLFFMLFKKIDIVHIHGSDVVSSLRKYLFLKIVEKFNCKTILHFHGASFMDQYPLKPRIWQDRIRYLFEQSNLVICLSKSWESLIREIVPGAKTIVLKNAVGLPAIHQNKNKEKGDYINLLFLGLIGERKGVFDLLTVVKRLHTSGYPIRLYIGGNGETERLKNKIKQFELDGIVHYLGWVRDGEKTDLFRNADVYILPSYGEGMPMSILEAMSFGLPVISTRVGGIPELVVEHKTGCLISPGDLDAMYRHIENLIMSPELRTQLGLNGRKTIKNQYDLNTNILKLDRIYQQL